MATVLYELIGWAGSILIVISLTMKSLRKLRLVGLAGAATFLVYGLLIGAYPIAIVNGVVIGIHLYHLRRMAKTDEYFSTLSVRPESRYLEYFCTFYEEDIRTFLPEFEFITRENQIRIFVLRDLVPAGLFMANAIDGGGYEVVLDYAIPQYRDFKIGRYVYSQASDIVPGEGPVELWSVPGSAANRTYLERMGYHQTERDGREVYRLEFARVGAAGDG